MAIYINRYENKKGVKLVQLLGSEEEFDRAGIDIEEIGAREHKPGRFNFRIEEVDAEEIIRKVEEFNRSLLAETAREWFTKDLDRGDFAIQFLYNWTEDRPVSTASFDRVAGGKTEGRIAWSLMWKDEWIDANGNITVKGRKEIRKTSEFITTMKASSR